MVKQTSTVLMSFHVDVNWAHPRIFFEDLELTLNKKIPSIGAPPNCCVFRTGQQLLERTKKPRQCRMPEGHEWSKALLFQGSRYPSFSLLLQCSWWCECHTTTWDYLSWQVNIEVSTRCSDLLWLIYILLYSEILRWKFYKISGDKNEKIFEMSESRHTLKVNGWCMQSLDMLRQRRKPGSSASVVLKMPVGEVYLVRWDGIYILVSERKSWELFSPACPSLGYTFREWGRYI